MLISRKVWRGSRLVASPRFLLVAGVLLFVACGEPDSSPGDNSVAQPNPSSPTLLITPVPTPDKEEPPFPDEPVPEPEPNEPINVSMEVALAPSSSPEELIALSDLIVTGTVAEILPPFWTTADGKRPSNPWAVGVVPDRYTILTPVVLELDGTLSLVLSNAAIEDQAIIIVAEGGRVGEDSVRSSAPWDQFAVGERVLVALSDGYPYTPNTESSFVAGKGSSWRPIAKYSLTQDGFAVTYDSEKPATEKGR